MIFIFSCSKDRIQKIYYNGIVWTGDDIVPMVSAIAVTDEFIIAIGGDEEILSMADQKTDKIDLLGKFVSPGFIDNHVHFISGGLQLSRVNLSDATTKEIFQERLVNFDIIVNATSLGLKDNEDFNFSFSKTKNYEIRIETIQSLHLDLQESTQRENINSLPELNDLDLVILAD